MQKTFVSARTILSEIWKSAPSQKALGFVKGSPRWPRWERAVWTISVVVSVLWIFVVGALTIGFRKVETLQEFESETLTYRRPDFSDQAAAEARSRAAYMFNLNAATQNILITERNNHRFWFGMAMTFGWVIAYWSALRTIYFFVERFKKVES